LRKASQPSILSGADATDDGKISGFNQHVSPASRSAALFEYGFRLFEECPSLCAVDSRHVLLKKRHKRVAPQSADSFVPSVALLAEQGVVAIARGEIVCHESYHVAKIGVTDLVLRPKGGMLIYQPVKRLGAIGEDFEFIGVAIPVLRNSVLLTETLPSMLRNIEKLLPHVASRKPKKPPPQREIDLLQRLIDQVHRTDQIKIVRKRYVARRAVLPGQLDWLTSILHERKALAKNLAEICPIHLVENHHQRDALHVGRVRTHFSIV
jgi:hypothetical protein